MIINNILNEEQCAEFLQCFLSTDENKRQIHPSNTKWGWGKIPIARKFLPIIEPLVFSIYGPDYTCNDIYTRAYYNNSDLGIHTDRPPLDITLSLCLRRDTPWTLNVSKKPWQGLWRKIDDYSPWLNDYVAYDILPGQGAICFGNVDPHWRDTLVCQPDQVNIYTFYHWTRNDKLHLYQNK